jgi:hypothetical protein
MTTRLLTKEEEEAIQKQGASSYATNGLNSRNPFYRTENKPTITGEDIKVWQAKVKAWESGYETEKLNRKGLGKAKEQSGE